MQPPNSIISRPNFDIPVNETGIPPIPPKTIQNRRDFLLPFFMFWAIPSDFRTISAAILWIQAYKNRITVAFGKRIEDNALVHLVSIPAGICFGEKSPYFIPGIMD